MPSLFGRSRTTSTHKSSQAAAAAALQQQQGQFGAEIDELGRISSRASTARTVQATSKATGGKKSRKQAQAAAEPDEPAIPDGAFLALSLAQPPPRRPQATASLPGSPVSPTVGDKEQDYGYLSYHRHVVLGLEEVDRLVRVLADELGQRGLTTPFIFSSLALDVSVQGVRRLIDAFLRTCAPFPVQDAERLWRDEVRFAAPAEVGMCLRWGLARVVRVFGGAAVRGLVGWDAYTEWAQRETALGYPPTHFAAFLQPLQPLLRAIIFNVLSVCARLTAHSASSGHTPPTLSPLFGPLLFGLGPAALAFQHAYGHYLRAVNAMEHLLLAFVRWQDAPSTQGSAKSLGVPARLKDWIRDYPKMLPERAKTKSDRFAPRRGARTVRVVSVRRNVRMYSPDLVKTASSWATRTPGGVTNTFAGSREWERVSPAALKLPPRYSDPFRKRMNLPAGYHPQVTISAASSTRSNSSSVSGSTLVDDDYFGLGKEDERFRNLTDMRWGAFEASGFSGTLDGSLNEKKLQFDLTETARSSRAAKRQTLSWTDFSSAGFSRTDDPLDATLQFSTPLTTTVADWPEQQEEMRRKLRKTQRALPPFGWDTEPVMGQEEVVEEAFLDVFCDLVYGGGWMDIEREEDVDRECNWALVEYRSLPVSSRSTTSGAADPRVDATVFLFEEFVPLEYRQSLSAGTTSKRRLPAFLFGTTSKTKPWKPAQTLNGRPYQVGLTPSSPTLREVEFEGMIRANGSTTKVISLNTAARAKVPAFPLDARDSGASTDSHASASTSGSAAPPSRITGPLYVAPRETTATPDTTGPATPTNKRSRFRLPTPGSGQRNSRNGMPPAEYEDLDFETRLASLDAGAGDDALQGNGRAARRSRDDAWVDILVANHGRRLGGQDAELRSPPARRPGGAREPARRGGDPEVASQEVARALEELSRQSGSDGSGDESEPEPMGVPHRSRLDSAATDGTGGTEVPVRDSAYSMVEPEDAYGGLEDDAPSASESESVSAPARRRVGYFDLHPERRPPGTEATAARVASPAGARPRTAESSEEEDYPAVTQVTQVPLPPAAGVQQVPLPSLIPRPKRDEDADGRSVAPSSASVLGNAGRIQLRKVEPAAPAEPPARLATSAGAPGRTAALIEMFKQRDAAAAGAPAAAAADTSVSPGAGGSPGGNIRRLPRPPKEELPLPPRPAEKEAAPAPAPADDDDVSVSDLEPPRLEASTPGRESPYRYVHGAPLHNVTEEEEEEE